MRRFLSPAFFVLVLVTLFLPFVTVSCDVGPLAGAIPETTPEGEEIPELPPDGNITILEATGYDIITDNIEPAEDLRQFEELAEETGGTQPQDETATPHGRIWIILAAVTAVAGIVLSLLAGRLGAVAAVTLGVLGAVFLGIFAMTFRSGLDRELAAEAEVPGFQASQFLDVSYQYGFWLALVFFLAAAAFGVWRLTAEREVEPVAVPPGEPVPPREPVGPPADAATYPGDRVPPPEEPAPEPTEPMPPPAEPAPPEEPMRPPAEPAPPPDEPMRPPAEPAPPPDEPEPRPRDEGGPPPS